MATAGAAAPPPQADAPLAYDIPAEPLEQALTKLGAEARIDLLYENGIVAGKRSTPITGVMSRQAALEAMLRGTGLLYRFTGPRAALVFPPDRLPAPASSHDRTEPSSPRMMLGVLRVRPVTMIGKAPEASYEPFGEALQSQIYGRLKSDPRIGARPFHARIAVGVDEAGVIRSIEVVKSTGDRKLDLAIRSALNDLALGGAPPPGMPQPVWFDLGSR
jgi:hypothetical protein